MANMAGSSTCYKWSFKTKNDYIIYLKNELDKACRNRRQVEYEIRGIKKELHREQGGMG